MLGKRTHDEMSQGQQKDTQIYSSEGDSQPEESEISKFYRLKFEFIKQHVTKAEIKTLPKYESVLMQFVLHSKLYNIDMGEVPEDL